MKPPGIKTLKVEMHKKWRKLLPAWAQGIMCPHPRDEVLKRIKKYLNFEVELYR